MKKRLVNGIIALTFLSVIAVGAANAQDAHKFAVEIPFPFVLEGRTLPAGRYELGRIDSAKPNVLMVKNTTARVLRLLLTQRAQKEAPSTTTYLLFERVGGKLYLAEIWTKGDMNGIRIPSIGGQERGQQPSDSHATVRLNLREP